MVLLQSEQIVYFAHKAMLFPTTCLVHLEFYF